MTLFRRLHRLLRRHRVDEEMRAEMRAHVELESQRLQREGIGASQARARAEREFGNLAQWQQRAREQSGAAWLEHWQRDFQQAARLLVKAPLLSLVIVLSLAVGIGANAVIFSWLRGVVFRPIPGVSEASKLVLIEPRNDAGAYPGASWAEYRDLRAALPAVQDLIAFRMLPLDYGPPGHEERAFAQLVSGNYFSGLGVPPEIGRLLRENEAAVPGGMPVVVISHEFWVNRFAASPDVIGKEIQLNARTLTVVGVAPEGFRGTVIGLTFDLWIPATMSSVLLAGPSEFDQREARNYSLLARPAPGAEAPRLQADVTGAMATLARRFPASNVGVTADVLPFWKSPRGAGRFLFSGLAVLQVFMTLVLVVVCANAANLLLARAQSRRREVGVRLALGARPRHILRLFLAEALFLGFLAAVLGSLLAEWGTEALRAVPLPGAFPFRFETELSVAGLVLSGTLGVVCALAFGLAPAIRSARTDSHLALRAAKDNGGRTRGRGALVALENGLALLVLVIAALFMRSFLESRTDDPGFRVSGVLLGQYDLSGRKYDRAAGLALLSDLLGRLNAVPGIESAAVASRVPLDFHAMPSAGFTIDGAARSDGGKDRALAYAVTPGYLELMGIPLVAGSDFVPLTDSRRGPQVIVNEEFVRRYLATGTPVGRRIVVGPASYEVAGVARNALYETFGERPKPVMYFSYRDWYSPMGQIHVRTRAAESLASSDLRRTVQGVNPEIILYDVRTMTEHVEKNLFFRRIPARLFGILGPLVLVLAATGVYAVVAYSVARRTTEIGIRMALGATRGRVVRQIVSESLAPVWLGIVPAWLIAVVIMIHANHGVLVLSILLGVPALLLAVVGLAAWLPARRAAGVDPVVALRAE
ncbi:MAG TPA: ADOP family duplicated permease [Candidatus Didemnitutus sp.]|nr:ADOP family duplicated permease [Candidatus Didemnitutus sp.]